MSCPTCDHTMEGCGYGIFHCPRCGTMVKDDTTYVPKLVKRCREFETWCKEGHGWEQTNVCRQWVSIGVAESINRPGARQQ